MVLTISVLTVNLLTGFITDFIVHYDTGIDPLKYTVIGMLSLVFILIPAYSYLSNRIELLTAKILASGSNSFGKYIGLLFSFALLFGILFSIYLHLWFGINILSLLKAKIS